MTKQTVLIEVNQNSLILDHKHKAAFGGVFQLGLLTEIRPNEFYSLSSQQQAEIKYQLHQLVSHCVDGLAGVGGVMVDVNSVDASSLSSLGFLIENVSKLARETLDKLERIEWATANKKPDNAENIAGFGSA